MSRKQKHLVQHAQVLYLRMIAESVNNLFGRTLNPRNRHLTSGGSSGGESALIAFGGSCLGVGTDIGMSCCQSAALNMLTSQRWLPTNTGRSDGNLYPPSLFWTIPNARRSRRISRSRSCSLCEWTNVRISSFTWFVCKGCC